jgi:hypothetical protein
MIDTVCSTLSMKSVDPSVKISNSGGGSEPAESVVIESERHTTTATTTATMSDPSGAGENTVARTSSQRPGTPTEVFNNGSHDGTDQGIWRARTQALEGGRSPGFFGAAMLLLRGSTNLRGTTEHCDATGSGETSALTQFADAITPDESNGGSALDGCLLHRDAEDVAQVQRRGRLRVAAGPYRHALFTAPDDSLQEQEVDRLPLVTINVSSQAILPEKRRLRTKHVVTYKKRKVIPPRPPSGDSTVPPAQARRAGSGGGKQEKAPSSSKTGLIPTSDGVPASTAEVVQTREPARPSNAGTASSALSTETYGITKRLSDKYQAQVFFARKSRYIGVFQTPAQAALAVSKVKKLLGKYKKPFQGDGDATFKKARDAALKAMDKSLSHAEPTKIGQRRPSTLTDASNSVLKAKVKDRKGEKPKPKFKSTKAKATSCSSATSKSTTDTSLSLLLLAAAVDADNDRGTDDTTAAKSSSASSVSAVDAADSTGSKADATEGSENVSSLPKQQKNSAAGDRKSTSDRTEKPTILRKGDPRVRAPGIRPQSAAHSLAASQPFPPERFEYVCRKPVYPLRDVFITLDKDTRVYVRFARAY